LRLDARKRICLDAMGIEVWRLRNGESGSNNEEDIAGAAQAASGVDRDNDPPAARAEQMAMGVAPTPERVPPALDSEIDLDWPALQEAVSHCRSCDLHQTRTQTVFGVGDHGASLMVIGEAPGADEDRLGEPFVGRAGKLLDAMLEAIGFARQQVYIANIIKCRPPGNRDPHIEEAASCQPYLHRQIALIQPKLILSVGRVSAHNLLGTEESVGRLRGRVHRFDPGDIPLIVTYHPAYLLRRPQEKARSWADLQAAYRVLNGSMG
jgi:DNA polymerase